jgi:hypothetical protein
MELTEYKHAQNLLTYSYSVAEADNLNISTVN